MVRLISILRRPSRVVKMLSIIMLWVSVSIVLVALLAATDAAATTSDDLDSSVLTREQLASFQRDGFLYIPQFFAKKNDDQALARLLRAGDATVQRTSTASSGGGKPFTVVEKGMIFGLALQAADNNKNATIGGDIREEERACEVAADDSSGECANFSISETVQAFRDITLRSKLVQASAELMQLDPALHTMRVLRDVFLAKPVESDVICDWHVDDQSFWPESFLTAPRKPTTSNSKDDGYLSSGINVWLAMDDMPAVYGGSMAVAKGSHTADWRFDAYRAIRQDRTKDGRVTKDDYIEIFRSPRENNTCNMHQSDPELRSKIEATKVVFDIRKGDVIFADRLLFHRTIAMAEDGVKYFRQLSQTVLNRYSIRYVPGTARLPSGFNFEESLRSNPANEARTLDDVAKYDNDALWYPQVWPQPDDRMDERLDEMAKTRYGEARAKQKVELQQVFAEIQAVKNQAAAAYSEAAQ